MLVVSTCISNDFFLKTLVAHNVIKIEKTKAEKIAYIIAKIMPAILGLVSIYLIYNPPSFMGVMVWIGISAVSSATLAPLVCALLTPRLVNSKAAIAGAIVGEAVYVYTYLIAKIERSVMACLLYTSRCV